MGIVERYKGRLIKANPNNRRNWYLYCVGARGIPVLYVGISPDPWRRFDKHKERFSHAPQPLTLRVWDKPMQVRDARRREIDMHEKHPHARTRTTALAFLTSFHQARSNAEESSEQGPMEGYPVYSIEPLMGEI